MKKLADSPKGKPNHGTHVIIAGRFTPAEAKHVLDAITKTGASKSAFVRSALLMAAEKLNFTPKP